MLIRDNHLLMIRLIPRVMLNNLVLVRIYFVA